MPARAVAHAARLSIDIAFERLRLGEVLLVFPEGTRSRARCLQPLLAGATRYLDGPGVRILPIGLTGSETLFPIGEETFRPVRIVARVGSPLDARKLHDRARGARRLMADGLGLAIAEASGRLPRRIRGRHAWAPRSTTASERCAFLTRTAGGAADRLRQGYGASRRSGAQAEAPPYQNGRPDVQIRLADRFLRNDNPCRNPPDRAVTVARRRRVRRRRSSPDEPPGCDRADT